MCSVTWHIAAAAMRGQFEDAFVIGRNYKTSQNPKDGDSDAEVSRIRCCKSIWGDSSFWYLPRYNVKKGSYYEQSAEDLSTNEQSNGEW